MTLKTFLTSQLLFSASLCGCTVLLTCGCNSEEILISQQGEKPTITLDSDDGIYTVKPGREFVIAPEFSNCNASDITWRDSDGKLLATGYDYRATYTEIGDKFITIEAINQAGTTTEDILIECVALTPPVISLDLAEGPLVVVANTDYTFAPDIQHADDENFTIAWFLNDKKVSDARAYTFNSEQTGDFKLRIEAENSDGRTIKEVPIHVVESKPYAVTFFSSSYSFPSTVRSTFAGRAVVLIPETKYFQNPRYSWSVNGNELEGENKAYLSFTPQTHGDYTVEVCVTEGTPSAGRALSRNVRQGSASARASVTVQCVDVDESRRRRQITSLSQPFANEVFEYLPAPGQFINDTTMFGGFTGSETTQSAANKYAADKLKNHFALSLGAFGGFITVGFDHSVEAGEGFDFSIEGNAYNSADGGSNEPGIVWVMQDVNGNGLPDDEWYELRASDYDNPATIHNYSVTYYRPEADAMPIRWTSSTGESGQVEYMRLAHKQPTYYPLWMPVSTYTLRGSKLPANNSVNTATGRWGTKAFAWGYADNMGSDVLPGSGSAGSPQQVGFKIANAVDALGRPVKLRYIDFVKIQSAVQGQSGPLGEVSTEVSSVKSCR